MTILRRTTPLGELISLRNTRDRLFDGTLARPRSVSMTAAPLTAPLSIPTAEAATPRQIQISPASEAQAEPPTEQDS